MSKNQTMPATLSLPDLLALHRAGIETLKGLTEENNDGLGYDPTDSENPWWNGELALLAVIAGLEAAREGNAQKVQEALRDFGTAYEDGELDAFSTEMTRAGEATYHALALRYAPTLLHNWREIEAAREIPDLGLDAAELARLAEENDL